MLLLQLLLPPLLLLSRLLTATCIRSRPPVPTPNSRQQRQQQWAQP
jgi:hypothetical protein